MKGLVLKDLYMLKSYAKGYLLMAVVFIAVSVVNDRNLFFIIYPCLLCSILPITLISYDEKSRWMQYSAALPYSGSQIVSVKYLLGLVMQVGMIIASMLAQVIRMVATGTYSANDLIVLGLMLIAITFLPPALCLPFIFRYGSEKGRFIYYIMIGIVCGSGIAASRFVINDLTAEVTVSAGLAAIAAAAIILYAASWYLSIRLFAKREL